MSSEGVRLGLGHYSRDGETAADVRKLMGIGDSQSN
jgi:hypothetical protein